MPSSQKTKNLKLNQWIGSDKPKRDDWNSDNEKLDTAYQQINQNMTQHSGNKEVHVTAAEKEQWSKGKNFSIQSYTGNGQSAQGVNIGRQADLIILFAVDKPLVVGGSGTLVYSGVATRQGCSQGVTLTENGFTVYNQKVAGPSGIQMQLNADGVKYNCIYW